MKPTHLVFMALLAMAAPADAQHRALEGCSSPTLVAEIVQKVDRLRGKDLTLDSIKKAWPNALDAQGCSPDSCTSMLHQGRIIDNHRECAEEFAVRSEAGNLDDRALSVTLTHSAHDRAELVRAAQIIGAAVGAPTLNLSKGRRTTKTEVHWKRKETKDNYWMTVLIEPKGAIWVMDIYLLRYSE